MNSPLVMDMEDSVIFSQAVVQCSPRDSSTLLRDKDSNCFSSLLFFLAYFLIFIVCLHATLLFHFNIVKKKINREE